MYVNKVSTYLSDIIHNRNITSAQTVDLNIMKYFK